MNYIVGANENNNVNDYVVMMVDTGNNIIFDYLDHFNFKFLHSLLITFFLVFLFLYLLLLWFCRTMPEKLNEMDFNNCYLIDQFSSIMTFDGVDRINNINSLRKHLTNVYNASIDNSNNNNNNGYGLHTFVCFVFTRRHSDAVYRILNSVGLIEFFRRFTKFNAELSYVVGFDHRLMQEKQFSSTFRIININEIFAKRTCICIDTGNDKQCSKFSARSYAELKKLSGASQYIIP